MNPLFFFVSISEMGFCFVGSTNDFFNPIRTSKRKGSHFFFKSLFFFSKCENKTTKEKERDLFLEK